METNADCPDVKALERLLLGHASEDEADALERHLAECLRCLETVRGLKPEDTVVKDLRSGVAVAEAIRLNHDAGQADVLRRLCPGWAEPSAQATRQVYDLLAPAQGPDEIGRLGPYRVLELLGVGGMGVVYRGEDTQLNRSVALKVMQPALALDPVARQRFRREAQAMAAVKHDHVAIIHQVAEGHGVPFLAMELLDGRSLEARLRSEGRLPVADVLRLGREVAEGLAAVHDRGLIHRDVKPGNIWLEDPKPSRPLAPGEPGFRTKLLDFGLVRVAGSDGEATQTGNVVGTPAYMAPEQAQGRALDARCDLFSLGCVLYRAATGVLPFPGDNPLGIVHALIHDTPRPVRALNPEVPVPLADLILKLLAKRPEDRFPSAGAVAQALRAVEARPAAKPPVRRRLPVLAAALLLLLSPLVYFTAPTVIRIATDKGELVLVTDDRDVEVTVKRPGGAPEVHVLDRHTQRELVLKAGEYEIAVKEKDGMEFTTRKLTLRRGGRTTFEARLVLPEPKAGPQELPDAMTVERVIGDGRWSHCGWVHAVAVSPDGRWVASASAEGAVRVWHAGTGEQRFLLEGHENQVLCVAFHPEGRLLATGGKDAAVKLWDAETGDCVRTLRMKGQVHTVAFHPDGRTVGGMTTSALQLWETESGKALPPVALRADNLEDVSGGFAFRPDGKLAYRVGADGVKVLDGATGKVEGAFPAEGGPVACLAYSPDGKTLAVGSQGPKPAVTVWDGETGQKRHTFRHAVAREGVLGLTFSPDGNRLAVVFCWRDFPTYRFSGRVRQWDVATGREGTPLPQAVYDGGVWCAAHSADGTALFTTGRDFTVRCWDWATGRQRHAPGGAVGHRLAMAVSRDGRTVAGGGLDGTIKLFHTATGAERRSLPGHTDMVRDLAFSPAGPGLASCGGDGVLRVSDWTTGAEGRSWQHSAGRLAFHPDGKLLATAEWGPAVAVRLWDVTTGAERHGVDPKGLGVFGQGLAFSPDGTALAASFATGPPVRWDLARGGPAEPLPRVPDGETAMELAYSPDGKTLAVAHRGPVWLYDVPTGKPRHTLTQTHHHVWTLAFSPDSRLLATGGQYDGTVRLWEAETGRLLHALPVGPRHGHVPRVRFVSNDRLAVLNGNGTIVLVALKRPSDPRADSDEPPPAREGEVTVTFTGRVETVHPKLAGVFTVGQTLTGWYRFRPTTPPRASATKHSAAYDALTHLSLRLGPYAASSTGGSEIQIDNDLGAPHHDRYFVLARSDDGLKGAPVQGRKWLGFGLRLDDSRDAALTTALELPRRLNLSDFDGRGFGLGFEDGEDSLDVRGTITSLSFR